jgi:hypothetical protein
MWETIEKSLHGSRVRATRFSESSIIKRYGRDNDHDARDARGDRDDEETSFDCCDRDPDRSRFGGR